MQRHFYLQLAQKASGQLIEQVMSKLMAPTSLSVTAVFWGAGGSAFRVLLQFSVQIVLARLLGPEQYGIFAIGAIVIGFSNFFSDIGLAYGLIQKKTVSTNDVRFVFTWQVILGIGVSTAIFFFAEYIALFFGDQRATSVVQALAAVCLLNALAAPSLNLLKRELDFKRIQIVQISGFILGYVVFGIPLALYGSQVWALVVAWLVQALAVFVLLYRETRHAVQPLMQHDEARALSTFGGTVFITNIVNWIIGNIDRVVIGRIFPSREIGLYATTYNMLQTPTASLLGILQPVFFATSSRMSDDRRAISTNYCALIAAVSTYALPVFVAVAAVSETFVLALYGPKWAEAATLFAPLALAMPLYLIWGITTPLLWTAGHASKEFKSQIPVAIAWALSTWLAAQHSIAAVAWSVLFLYLLRCLVIVRSATYYLQFSRGALWLAARGGLGVALIVGLAVKTCDLVASPLPPLFRLITAVLVGALSLFTVLKLAPGLRSPELAMLNRRIIERLPKRIANRLNFLCTVNNK
jgi:O-antigen/teichoic acid export membrane protein